MSKQQAQVRNYSSESTLKSLSSMFYEMVADFKQAWELGYRLLRRDLSVEYRESFLGFFWAFAPPLLTAVALSIARRADIFQVADISIPYAAYIASSMLLFQIFQQGIQGIMDGFIEMKDLMGKVRFPVEALIIAKGGNVVFTTVIRLILLIAIFVYFKIPVSSTLLWAPFTLATLMLVGIASGILLGPLVLLSQDLLQGIGVILRLLIFISPVLYPMPKGTLFEKFLLVNPVSAPLAASIDVILLQETNYIGHCAVVFGLGCVMLCVSWVFLKISIPLIVERSG